MASKKNGHEKWNLANEPFEGLWSQKEETVCLTDMDPKVKRQLWNRMNEEEHQLAQELAELATKFSGKVHMPRSQLEEIWRRTQD